MLRPWREATGAADLDDGVDLALARGAWPSTRRRTVPSARYMTSSGPTASASPSQEMYMRCLSPSPPPSPSPQTKVRSSPGPSSTTSSRSLPMRSFGPGRSCRIATWRPARPGGVAHALDDLGVLLGAAVGEVQPRDVHPGLDHPHQDLGIAGGRADGRDDLRPAHGSVSITRAATRSGSAAPQRHAPRHLAPRAGRVAARELDPHPQPAAEPRRLRRSLPRTSRAAGGDRDRARAQQQRALPCPQPAQGELAAAARRPGGSARAPARGRGGRSGAPAARRTARRRRRRAAARRRVRRRRARARRS